MLRRVLQECLARPQAPAQSNREQFYVRIAVRSREVLANAALDLDRIPAPSKSST